MKQREGMLAELPYRAWLDGLAEERQEAKKKVFRFNHTSPEDQETLDRLIREIIGAHGEHLTVEQPFHCDYGSNIEVGENFFANYNLTILDVAKVVIGSNVQIAPNVSIYTAGHPLDPEARNSGYEYGIGITVGDNVWIGGNTVINPGVHIGDNVVIGSGSVVTRDIPDNAIAVGNPCKVLRYLTEEDKKYYYKDREFDVDFRE